MGSRKSGKSSQSDFGIIVASDKDDSESEVIVIGTGLGALGATLALLDSGVSPVVIDVGEELPANLNNLRNEMSAVPPSEWRDEDVLRLSANTSAKRTGVPRKLVLGSDYFYGTKAGIPPHSFALGGFSAGWGAAFLPPSKVDLAQWPVKHEDLLEHARLALKYVNISEPEDGLTPLFPKLCSSSGPTLKLGRDQESLVNGLQEASAKTRVSEMAYGQSRLMTHAPSSRPPQGTECRQCGFCMSGCVYGAIFDAGAMFKSLAEDNRITLLKGERVHSFEEHSEYIEVRTVSSTSQKESLFRCQRLFLAAGAVESTRIVVRSVAPETTYVDIIRPGGAVIPLISKRRLPSDWPNTNTQSSVFLEMIDSKVSEHWIHTQLGPSNELLLGKLGLARFGRNARQAKFRWAIFERLAVALVNLHSDHGSRYRMHFGSDGQASVVSTELIYSAKARREAKAALKSVRKALRDAGLYSLRPLEKDSSKGAGYHLGGSLPMRDQPKTALDTDSLGRPQGCKKVHVVDASVFTSLPGTTIGVVILANAHRIASSVEHM